MSMIFHFYWVNQFISYFPHNSTCFFESIDGKLQVVISYNLWSFVHICSYVAFPVWKLFFYVFWLWWGKNFVCCTKFLKEQAVVFIYLLLVLLLYFYLIYLFFYLNSFFPFRSWVLDPWSECLIFVNLFCVEYHVSPIQNSRFWYVVLF